MKWLILLSLVVSWVESKNTDGAVDLSYMCVHLENSQHDLAPIFLLHGLTADSYNWAGVYQVLALQTRRRVCAADARNHGRSPQTEEFNYDVLSADQIRLMDRLNVSKAILVGHSMGGRTSAVIALQHPERVEKLIVEDMRPNSMEPNAFKRANFTFQILSRSLDAIPEGATLEEAQEAVVSFVDNTLKQVAGVGLDEKERALLLDQIVCVDGSWKFKPRMEIAIRAITDPEFFKRYDGLYEGDALFIYGKESESKVGEAEEEIKELFPKAQLLAIEGAGHLVHDDKPKEFLSAVIKFINED